MCFLYHLSVHWIIYAIIIKIYSIFLNVYSIANNSDSLAGTGLGSHRNWLQGLDSPLIQPNEEDDGQKELKLRFDVSQYNPDEIMVKTVDNKLLVSDVDKYFNFFLIVLKFHDDKSITFPERRFRSCALVNYSPKMNCEVVSSQLILHYLSLLFLN